MIFQDIINYYNENECFLKIKGSYYKHFVLISDIESRESVGYKDLTFPTHIKGDYIYALSTLEPIIYSSLPPGKNYYNKMHSQYNKLSMICSGEPVVIDGDILKVKCYIKHDFEFKLFTLADESNLFKIKNHAMIKEIIE